MFESVDKYDVVECPVPDCDYRAPVAHVVPHILGSDDTEHERIVAEENLRADRF